METHRVEVIVEGVGPIEAEVSTTDGPKAVCRRITSEGFCYRPEPGMWVAYPPHRIVLVRVTKTGRK